MIDYKKLSAAIDYYENKGFELIDVPWCVQPEADAFTRPELAEQIKTRLGVHIGSGEQGFIDMMLDGLMPIGKYMTVTPCFRHEKEYSELTRPWFLKLELIDYKPKDMYKSLIEITNASYEFFKIFIEPDVIATNLWEFDIISKENNIELGSYGVRKMDQREWVYGTGLAEPRLSTTIDIIKRNKWCTR